MQVYFKKKVYNGMGRQKNEKTNYESKQDGKVGFWFALPPKTCSHNDQTICFAGRTGRAKEKP